MKKFLTWYLISLPVGMLGAFVAMEYWNWFVTRALHVDEIGFLPMLGLIWFTDIFRGGVNQPVEEARWTLLVSLIEAAAPEDRQIALQRAATDYLSDDTIRAVKAIFNRLSVYFGSLAVGFILHLFV